MKYVPVLHVHVDECSFEISILILTPRMLETYVNDKIFAIDDSFMWTIIGKGFRSPI